MEAKVIVQCPKCGRGYFSTNQFQIITDNEKELLVCPVCYKENTGKSSSSRFVTIGLSLIFLGILCVFIYPYVFLLFLIVGIICIIIGAIDKNINVNEEILKTIKKSQEPEKSPMQVLNLRYAKGEISKEEYEQMKKDIKKKI